VVDTCITVVVHVLWPLEVTAGTLVGENCARGPVSTAEVAGYVADENTVLSVGVELAVGMLIDEELVVIGKLDVMFCST
jgi:hypothetical protein